MSVKNMISEKDLEKLPIWLQLRIAYEYATPEEIKEFNKLTESILLREDKRDHCTTDLELSIDVFFAKCMFECRTEPLLELPPPPCSFSKFDVTPECRVDCKTYLQLGPPPCTGCLNGSGYKPCGVFAIKF